MMSFASVLLEAGTAYPSRTHMFISAFVVRIELFFMFSVVLFFVFCFIFVLFACLCSVSCAQYCLRLRIVYS
jgi:hypothetical protein